MGQRSPEVVSAAKYLMRSVDVHIVDAISCLESGVDHSVITDMQGRS